MRITPSVGTVGLYEVRTPWTVTPEHVYECIANRKMEDLIDRGIDILDFVYHKVNLGEAEYAADVAEGACIISLRDTTDSSVPVIHIPDTYIISYPNMDVSNYNRCVVSVDLGALPINTDVTGMIVALKQAALDMVGVESSPKVHKAPSSGNITLQQHQELLRKRIAYKKRNTSIYVQNENLVKENTELRRQLDEALKFIQSKGL